MLVVVVVVVELYYILHITHSDTNVPNENLITCTYMYVQCTVSYRLEMLLTFYMTH